MQTAATTNLSVRPSVCLSVLSVTFRCFVQMNEDTIVRYSASDRTIILYSPDIRKGSPLARSLKLGISPVASENLINN